MTFRVGDRVMQTRNNYDVLWEKEDGSGGSGIFNGDVGVIQDIDPGGEYSSPCGLTTARRCTPLTC